MHARSRFLWLTPLLAIAPLLGGAKGDGCKSINSRSPAPDASGEWAIDYDDTLAVEIRLGGATYAEEIGLRGGSFTIEHEGKPLTFDLDCAKPEIVCPSEKWPGTVTVSHREPEFPHRMWVTLPGQECTGELVDPDPSECGPDTQNPDCEKVCMGETVMTETDTFGVIDEEGTAFDLFLGAGIATNGINCALLGVSSAHANLENSGSAEEGAWRVERMAEGEVVAAYTGGCLWAGDPDMDEELEALVLGAEVKFTTGFVGQRL